MHLLITDGKNEDFIALCKELDDFLNEIAGGEQNRAQYLPHNRIDASMDVIVAYEGNLALGCAAIQPYSDSIAEVKRVFVRRAYRRKGAGECMLRALEKLAAQKGYRHLILETGAPLAAATALYEKLGFVAGENYGPYKDMPQSVCMVKNLS